MTFVKELIFIDIQEKLSQKGNKYITLRTDDNFFISCFNEKIIPMVRKYCPTKCVVKLDNGSKKNDYKKSLLLLDINKSDIEVDTFGENEIPF